MREVNAMCYYGSDSAKSLEGMLKTLVIVAAIAVTVATALPHHLHRKTEHQPRDAHHHFRNCHNITGACMDHGFVCANGEVVKHAERCNGVEECADGTDEYLCDHPLRTPLHEQPEEARAQLAQSLECVHCNCAASTITVGGPPWLAYAKLAPLDRVGLGTGSGTYRGLGCAPSFVTQMKVTFYRKTNVCRGYLCCLRQVECVACSGGKSATFANRCYA